MGVDREAHRSGALKQSNKSHKTGRHRSKGAIDNEQKGKVSVKAFTRKNKNQSKEQRRNQANQIRHNKRQEVLAKKRSLGTNSDNVAPFLVCILPLNEAIDSNSALEILRTCDPNAVITKSPSGATHITIPRFKQRFSFVIPPIGHGADLTVLDYLKVCDTTLLLVSAIADEDDIFDRWGQRIINEAIAQGIPTPIVTVLDLESIAPNRRIKTKAAIQKHIEKSFPEHKISTLETETDGLNIFRRIGGQKRKVLYNKDKRSHLYAEQVEYCPNEDDSGSDFGTLKVTGFIRGTQLDVNHLVHIPGLGDFQMSKIISADDYMNPNRREASNEIFVDVDVAKQTSLQRENIPEEMDAEQTFPTEEEIAHARAETKKAKLIKRVPKGMSDYQACWIPDIEEKEEGDDESNDDMSDDESGSDESQFMSCESDKESADEFEKDENEEDFDTMTISEAPVNDEKYDLDMDLQEERETWEKIKEARSDQQWPDERDTPLNVDVRTRFQKYRGLESFRTSPWDPKENLPFDYARVYQFKNFDRTKRRILNEIDELHLERILPGHYITIHVANVLARQWNTWTTVHKGECLVLYGLLPHEHQMSVMNVVLKRTPGSTVPIKSKERMIVQCGYRRFIVNPIFSQHTNSDRHKYERYFRPGDTVVATFYAPIQFPPSPILCFQENPDTSLRLVANGILLSCNPNRIILKRLVLSGHPFKINRRTATIRYMFHNRGDVEYFKPVKLRTRCGRLGHIKETLGTHGHMKCVFDGQLKSHDTVFMYLYKRVFPKWTYEECIVSNADSTVDTEMK